MHFAHVRFALEHWLLVTIALLMLPHWGAGVNLSACVHCAHVRFALVHWLLCDRCAANVATVGGRSKPERLYAFCACAFCIGGLATCDHCAANVAALGGRNKIVERDTLKTFVECQSACLRVEFNTSDVFSWIVNARFWFHVDVPASNAFNFDCGSNEANRYEQGLARK